MEIATLIALARNDDLLFFQEIQKNTFNCQLSILNCQFYLLSLHGILWENKYKQNNKSKNTVNKEYSINIYDLKGKLVMSFIAFNVDGNDNTIFYEDRDGKQRIVYVPNDTIVTIEEV